MAVLVFHQADPVDRGVPEVLSVPDLVFQVVAAPQVAVVHQAVGDNLKTFY